MKVLHVTPHLGGGVGKAHAAIRSALPPEINQTFVLLEEARDRRYADLIEARGAAVVTARSLDNVADLAAGADIVQFEFWNHPRLFECLARATFPPMRTLFWSHISGLSPPVIQPGLIEQAGRFVFTTEASRAMRSIAMLSGPVQGKLAVINSGFGFASAPPRAVRQGRTPAIAYLGTVDFIKMHSGFFDVIDRLNGDIQVSVWGAVNPAVAERACAMRHPQRIRFGGQTAEPAVALGESDIFFYPLQREHYGTAENALIEAMSLGLVPVVLDNRAERAIVRDGETGFVARSIDECVTVLQKLMDSPDLLNRVSRNAVREIAATRTPERSAHNFMPLWQAMAAEPARISDFRKAIGDTPAQWFLATQALPGETWQPPEAATPQQPSKGMLAHFQSAFPDDPSLARLTEPI